MGKTTYLLTADIGGTTSRLSLYKTDSDKPVREKSYRNQEVLPADSHSNPETFSKYILVPFLTWSFSSSDGEKLVSISNANIVACIATAGHVADNKVNMTNLGNLLVNGTAVENDTSNDYVKAVSVCKIINDFVAAGYGCLTLDLSDSSSEVQHLHGPKIDASAPVVGPKVCVGAGTGLGECYLTPSGPSSYECYASEGGHVEYAPTNELESELWKFLTKKFDEVGDGLDSAAAHRVRISVERIVSGMGLSNVYEFLAAQYPNRVDAKMHAEFEAAAVDERPKIISDYAKEHAKLGKDSLCRQALTIMFSAYGCEVGSAAIKFIPTAGLFVTGGLTPKHMEYIDNGASDGNSAFMRAYLHKGRVKSVLESIPLYAVKVEDLGIRGALKVAKELKDKKRNQCVSAWAQHHAHTAMVFTAAVGFLAALVLKNKKLI